MSPFCLYKRQITDWTEITNSGTRQNKKNQPNTIQKCHGYPTEMTFVFDFLTCKLTFQWLLIDYRYGFYVLLPS